MAQIIDGKILAEKIKDKVVKEIVAINKGDKNCPVRPNLAIILVGEREDSKIYIKIKEREAKKVGIDTHVYRCEKNIEEREIFEMIDCLNNDESIDAILLQLPLPEGFDTDGIIRAIDPAKDVDCFHPDNLKTAIKNYKQAHILPPVFNCVLEILENIKYEYAGTRAVIISNSDIFGKSLAKVLGQMEVRTESLRSNDPDLAAKTREADILVSAVGKPRFITKDMVKEDAVVIDVGITKEGEKIVGDVDFDDVENLAGYITPVPGGVGPMTVAMLFLNTLKLFKQKRKIT